MKVGDAIDSSQLYGKKNILTGIITEIEEKAYQPQPHYRGMDIITIEWDNGTIAKFYRENIHYPLLQKA